MLPDKPIKVVASPGKLLPIFYNGSIIHIGNTPVEIDPSKLKYESKAQLKEALQEGHILEVEN